MAEASVLNRFELPGGDRDNKLVVEGSMESGVGANLKTKFVYLPIGNVSSAGNSDWVVPGFAGTVISIINVIDAPLDSGGSDAGLTFKINTILIDDSAITITASGSAEGDVDQSFPTDNNTITSLDTIEVIKDGLSDFLSNGFVTFEILLS